MFYEKFGNKLIYEVPQPVSFNLGASERLDRTNDFINRIDTVYQNRALGDFLEANAASFYDNKIERDYKAPNGEVIQAGSKIVKAFKYFESNEECLAQMQNEASMIIQADKITGTLCFSIHPLDFLSSSENNHNWRSCHALDGDYRAGNLSYMSDKTTIICYLKSAQDEVLPRFPTSVPWNSKKWRMLLTYDQNTGIMFAGRQYPFFSEGALNTITPHLRAALRQNQYYWSDWHDDHITHWKYKNGNDNNNGILKTIPIGEKLFVIYDLVQDVSSASGYPPLHFNDLVRSSCYSPFYCWNVGMWRADKECHISVGNGVKCLKCGEKPILESEFMVCEDCKVALNSEDQILFVCEHCGGGYPIEEAEETQDGSLICHHCMIEATVRCGRCGDLLFRDDALWDRENNYWMCNTCVNEIEEEKSEENNGERLNSERLSF